MSISHDPRERQKDELQALRSIFPDDVQDLRKDGRDWMPLELLITVKPQTSFNPDKQPVACVQLYVKCPHDYPYAELAVEVRDPHAVPSRAVDFLTKELHRLIQENAGSEVIFILISYIQEFLSPFNFNCEPQPRPSLTRAARSRTTSLETAGSDVPPAVPDAQRSAYSRFAEEFELVEKLGAGGFGDVFKARNKLDGQEYAIKKVPINLPEKQHHKIFREVKLLSRLVHENIVRYYSNWVETEGIASESDSCSSGEIITSTVEDPDESMFRKSLILPACSMSSNYIQYERSEGHDDSDDNSIAAKSSVKEETNGTNESSIEIPLKRFMFIQMELCEQRTLRDWIDDKTLLNDHKLRVHLFREIVEGLAYLHSCLIVHRDLKPGNIFFVKGHAKIGDLGLAISVGKGELLSEENVGTFHYFAPELDHVETSDRLRDSNKLDIFSLGVTVFEMFYRPIKTGMERHQILTNLRKSPAEFPADFRSFHAAEEYEELISRMISRDPDQRPSANELLESSLVPPNDLEDGDKNWIIKQLTSNKSDKDFRKVLDNLFANHMSPSMVQFFGYDRFSDEVRRESTSRKVVHPRDRRRVSEVVRTVLIEVMKRYGAIQMATQTFSPKSQQADLEKLLLIDQKGNLIYPTFSLRESFIRFVSKHHISSVRRYAIEKVYRKPASSSLSPVEMSEVAFDAVFPIESPPILPESVLLLLVSDIVSNVPGLSSQQLILKISHNAIFMGILRYCDLSEEQKQREVIALLSDHSDDFAFFEKETRVRDLVADNVKAKLIHAAFVLQKDSFSDFRDTLKQLVRRKQSSEQKRYSSDIMAAVLELKLISKSLGTTASDLTLKFCGYLAENSDYYTGFVVQLEQQRSGNESPKLLAVGGRYDLTHAESSFQPSTMIGGVGVSFELERLVSLALQDENRNSSHTSLCDTAVAFCPLNHDPEKSHTLLLENIQLCKFLRSAGLRVMELFDTVHIDNLNSFCRENRVRAAVLLIEDAEDKQEISCRLFFYDKDRPSEKKVQCYSQREVTDALKSVLKYESMANGDTSPASRTESKVIPAVNPDACSISEKSNANFINMQFLNMETPKLAAHQKKRHEITFSNLLSTSLSTTSHLPVLAVDLPFKQVKMIANEIDMDDDTFKLRKNLDSACSVLSEKLPRLKKHLPLIMDEIHCLKTSKKASVITLYSYTENKFVTFC